LIEAVGALGIIGLILSAITVAVMTSLNNATYDQNQTLAAKYAQQGTELVTQVRDQNYTSFQGVSGTHCLASGATTLGPAVGSCSANVGAFIREVQIQRNGCAANVSRVSVLVEFKDGKCTSGTYCHIHTDVSCLSTVNPVQTP